MTSSPAYPGCVASPYCLTHESIDLQHDLTQGYPPSIDDQLVTATCAPLDDVAAWANGRGADVPVSELFDELHVYVLGQPIPELHVTIARLLRDFATIDELICEYSMGSVSVDPAARRPDITYGDLVDPYGTVARYAEARELHRAVDTARRARAMVSRIERRSGT